MQRNYRWGAVQEHCRIAFKGFLAFIRRILVKQTAERFNILPEGQLLWPNIPAPRAAFCWQQWEDAQDPAAAIRTLQSQSWL